MLTKILNKSYKNNYLQIHISSKWEKKRKSKMLLNGSMREEMRALNVKVYEEKKCFYLLQEISLWYKSVCTHKRNNKMKKSFKLIVIILLILSVDWWELDINATIDVFKKIFHLKL